MNTNLSSSQTIAARPAAIGALRHKGIDMLYSIEDAVLMQQVVDTIRTKTEEQKMRQDFLKHYNLWWNETCMYSGVNFYVRNTHFKALVKMGEKIVPLIKEMISLEPDYKQDFLQLLLSTITKE